MPAHKILCTIRAFPVLDGPQREVFNGLGGLKVAYEGGPFKDEARMLQVVRSHLPFDGVVACVDNYGRAVIRELANGGCRIIARAGVGTNNVDMEAAREHGVAVTRTPGINHVSMAHHAIALLLAGERKLVDVALQPGGPWNQVAGDDVFGETAALLGFGMIGQENAQLLAQMRVNVRVFDVMWDETKAATLAHIEDDIIGKRPPRDGLPKGSVRRCTSLDEAVEGARFIFLHMDVRPETQGIIGRALLSRLAANTRIVNTARGELVDEEAIVEACRSGHIRYYTDTYRQEPQLPDSPFLTIPNFVGTPHIGPARKTNGLQMLRAAQDVLITLGGYGTAVAGLSEPTYLVLPNAA